MPWHEVVGVVQDVRENGVDQVSPATVYWPSLMGDPFVSPGKLGAWRTVYFAMRSNRAGTQAFINEMQQAVWSVNSNLPVADISTMQDIYSESMAAPRSRWSCWPLPGPWRSVSASSASTA
jgi:hypothetical protein